LTHGGNHETDHVVEVVFAVVLDFVDLVEEGLTESFEFLVIQNTYIFI
jgi:hypothetical protein